MNTKQIIFCVAAFVIALINAQHDHRRVNVVVYYESLCPDSIEFFTQQLYPSLQGNLSHYVNLSMVPFGNATFTQHDSNEYDFVCHHGPAECHGNKLQICAIELIDSGKKTEGLGFNKITTGFINCLMDKVKPSGDKTEFPTRNCASLNHVNILSDIENCANHPQGSRLLADLGRYTQQLQPPLSSVPTIVFNNHYKKEDSDMARHNFVKVVCQYIDEEKPSECNGCGNFKMNFTLLLVLIISVFGYIY